MYEPSTLDLVGTYTELTCAPLALHSWAGGSKVAAGRRDMDYLAVGDDGRARRIVPALSFISSHYPRAFLMPVTSFISSHYPASSVTSSSCHGCSNQTWEG